VSIKCEGLAKSFLFRLTPVILPHHFPILVGRAFAAYASAWSVSWSWLWWRCGVAGVAVHVIDSVAKKLQLIVNFSA